MIARFHFLCFKTDEIIKKKRQSFDRERSISYSRIKKNIFMKIKGDIRTMN